MRNPGGCQASPGRLFLYFTPCSNSALWKGIMALGCFSERRGKGYFTAAFAFKGQPPPPSAGVSAPTRRTFVRGACPYLHTYTHAYVCTCIYRSIYTPLCERGWFRRRRRRRVVGVVVGGRTTRDVSVPQDGGLTRGPLSRRLPASFGGLAHQPDVDPAVAVGGRELVTGRAERPPHPAALLLPGGLQRELLRRELLPPLQTPRRPLRTLRLRGGRHLGLPARLDRRVLHRA